MRPTSAHNGSTAAAAAAAATAAETEEGALHLEASGSWPAGKPQASALRLGSGKLKVESEKRLAASWQ